MKKQLFCKLLSCLIEWHWRFIMRNRRKITRCLGSGKALTSETVLRFNRKIDYHSDQVMALTQIYLAYSSQPNRKPKAYAV